MKKKTPAMICLECGKILAILRELGPGVYGIDEDSSKRFKADEYGN